VASSMSTMSKSTPHARGSTRTSTELTGAGGVYPACAGIHLMADRATERERGLPRMRGDPPQRCPMFPGLVASTPHARGSTRKLPGLLRPLDVYPACAGIHPSTKTAGILVFRLPRMRGDPPVCAWRSRQPQQSTPHARGSTLIIPPQLVLLIVYPACAGIHH